MTTENTPAVQKPEMRTGGAVMAFVPQDYDQAWRLASTIVKADMAPNGLKTTEKVMVAIMHGQEVGFTPMAALQSIAVINGRPTIWGDGALGLVQGSGKMESIRETIEGEGDARMATCTVIRKGDKEPKTSTFSVADAKAAGLWKKAGPWTQYPDRMLKMRARSWALRDGFSDVLKGLGVTEEVQDFPAQEVDHSVVSSEPLRQDATAAEIKMPGVVRAAQAEPEAQPAAEIIAHAPDVEYMDQIQKVQEFEHKGAPYFGIYTLVHGKKPMGTPDAALAEAARNAAGGEKIQVVYTIEGKGMKLVRLGPAPTENGRAADQMLTESAAE